MENKALVTKEDQPLSPAEVSNQISLIQAVMRDAMKVGEHYGTIPGCGDKQVLFKAGAEKLSLTFRMAPKYDIDIQELKDGHRNYQVKCELYHIASGNFLGGGVGSCSTMETKYRYRGGAQRKCPDCGNDAIIKGKAEYGGGWVCFKKKGGCGAKFADGDQAIESQSGVKSENTDIADTYNTVLKMAKKRAHVDAVLTATAASDIFTQDIEESYIPPTKDKEAEIINVDASFPVADGVSTAPEPKAVPKQASAFTIETLITGVFDKTTSKGKPYWLIVDEEGGGCKTWNGTTAAYAKSMMEQKKRVLLSTKPGEYGIELTSLVNANA